MYTAGKRRRSLICTPARVTCHFHTLTRVPTHHHFSSCILHSNSFTPNPALLLAWHTQGQVVPPPSSSPPLKGCTPALVHNHAPRRHARVLFRCPLPGALACLPLRVATVMPTVSVDRDELYRRLGCPGLSVPAFEELCFAFGVELDDVLTSEQAAAARQHSEEVAPTEEGAVTADGAASAAAAGSKVLYYIATPANRSDLLCIEGLARAFNIFQQRMAPPV